MVRIEVWEIFSAVIRSVWRETTMRRVLTHERGGLHYLFTCSLAFHQICKSSLAHDWCTSGARSRGQGRSRDSCPRRWESNNCAARRRDKSRSEMLGLSEHTLGYSYQHQHTFRLSLPLKDFLPMMNSWFPTGSNTILEPERALGPFELSMIFHSHFVTSYTQKSLSSSVSSDPPNM